MAVDVQCETTIPRPREEVAAYAADPDRTTSWYANIDRVEWQTPRPGRVREGRPAGHGAGDAPGHDRRPAPAARPPRRPVTPRALELTLGITSVPGATSSSMPDTCRRRRSGLPHRRAVRSAPSRTLSR